MGMVQFVAKFILSISQLSEPLHALTKKNSDFFWGPEQKAAFDSIKEKLKQKHSLVRFDISRPTALFVDASPVAIGAILTQRVGDAWAPVEYAGKVLSDVQRRFIQTEREALAIKIGIEKFHNYLYGSPTLKVFTDHKPLVSIFREGSRPTLRIEKWVVSLQGYAFEVQYRPGEGNPADYIFASPERQSKRRGRTRRCIGSFGFEQAKGGQ